MRAFRQIASHYSKYQGQPLVIVAVNPFEVFKKGWVTWFFSALLWEKGVNSTRFMGRFKMILVISVNNAYDFDWTLIQRTPQAAQYELTLLGDGKIGL